MVTRYLKDSHLHGAGETIIGQVRKVNEDHCDYCKTCNGELFVVCDGMGGHVGGATASHIGVRSIIEYISQHPSDDKPALINEALLFANMQIMGAAAQEPSLKGMGTTACVVLINGEDIWLGHVGDSRIYLYSENEHYLYRISKDHSLVQSLVDNGDLDDREAEHHPQKNIILRALGTREDLMTDVETTPVKAQAGDIFLICSDGLSGMIDDNEVEAILASNQSLEDKVQTLISAANEPGKGLDNITAQLIQVLSSAENLSVHPNFNPSWRKKPVKEITKPVPEPVLPIVPTPRQPRKKALWLTLSGIFVCLIAFLVWFMNRPETDKPSPARHYEAEVRVDTVSDTHLKQAQEEAKKAKAEAKKAQKEVKKAQAQLDAEAKAKEEAQATAQKEAEARAKAEAEARQAEAKSKQAQLNARQAQAEARYAEAEAIQAQEHANKAIQEAAQAQAQATQAQAQAVEAQAQAVQAIEQANNTKEQLESEKAAQERYAPQLSEPRPIDETEVPQQKTKTRKRRHTKR